MPRRPRISVAIVEAEPRRRQALCEGLRGDFKTLEAQNYAAAYELLQQEPPPDILLLAIESSRGGLHDAADMLRAIAKAELDTVVIALGPSTARKVVLRVLEAGAYDYFPTPPDLEQLRVVMERAAEKQCIERENRVLREELRRQQSFGDLVGTSAAMQEVYEAIRRVADSSATVIVRGESGTGKELVARSIHEHSPRAAGPFVSVNCAAFPESLMEAELFGYEKGAFTGADDTKEGRFELANGGTLFLDEIGTLGLPLQTKLLRVLEERGYVRLGGRKGIKVDIRLITATNENLEEMVAQRRFREDLYYRIQVVPIDIPPLRRRAEDIPLLLNHFLEVYCLANNAAQKRLDEEAMDALERYAWPGNVRELQNVMLRLVLMTSGLTIGLKSLPATILRSATASGADGFQIPPDGIDLEGELRRYEAGWLRAALGRANGVKAKAARWLGLNRDQMKYLCRKHGLGGGGVFPLTSDNHPEGEVLSAKAPLSAVAKGRGQV